MKIYIVQLATMGEEALKGRRLRSTVKTVKLAFESAINKIDTAIADEEEKIVRHEMSIAKGETSAISALVGAKLNISEYTQQREILVALKKKFYSKSAKAEADKEYDGEEDAE
jgi:hypothetical protein